MFLQIHTITMQVQTAWVKRKNLQVCLQHVVINNLLRSLSFLFLIRSLIKMPQCFLPCREKHASLMPPWCSFLCFCVCLCVCVPMCVCSFTFVCFEGPFCFTLQRSACMCLTSLLDVRTVNANLTHWSNLDSCSFWLRPSATQGLS